MATGNFNIRLDEDLRAEVTHILAGYGLSPTQAVKLFFNQVVATRKVPLSFDFQAMEKQPTPELLRIIEQNKQEQLQGKSKKYTNFDEMMADLSE